MIMQQEGSSVGDGGGRLGTESDMRLIVEVAIVSYVIGVLSQSIS